MPALPESSPSLRRPTSAADTGDREICLKYQTHATQIRVKAINAAAKKALQTHAGASAQPKVAQPVASAAAVSQRELAQPWLPKADPK
eukprot:3049734-Amphidinium_carterae.1